MSGEQSVGYFWHLERFADNLAIIDEAGVSWTYNQIAREADKSARSAAQLVAGVARPLVLLEASNTLKCIVAYIGALRANWPIMLASYGSTEKDSRIVSTYQPNLVFTSDWKKHSTNPVDCHPDLHVLLSTSGTTGSPKLVRLSSQNIQSNADAICNYLEIDPSGKAITTLEFSYSYGMSVVHSYLNAGACLILTDQSLLESHFWETARLHGATSMALVPFQFELLDRVKFEDMELASLRTITQAGGRLAPSVIKKTVEQGKHNNRRLFVMYGQTEAAPRMAYVPPDKLPGNVETIGIAIPGGKLSLRDESGKNIPEGVNDIGELVYEGPNVMMGYATCPADFALPQGPNILHTGDNAQRQANGFFKIVGRKNRFLKLYGLRINLDDVEAHLQGIGVDVLCTGTDKQLDVFTVGASGHINVTKHIQNTYELPLSSFRVHTIANADEVPRLSNGKPDYPQLAQRAADLVTSQSSSAKSIVEAMALALNVSHINPELSFSEHGGDSLAFIEAELAMGKLLGSLPEGWEHQKISELAALQTMPVQKTELLRTDVAWRTLAMSTIIALHATALPVAGGASLLVLLIGNSLANHQKKNLSEGRVLAVLKTQLLPILTGYYAVLAAIVAFWTPIDWSWFALLGNFQRNIVPHGIEPYWFVCFYAQVLLGVCAISLLPGARAQISKRAWSAGLCVALALCIVHLTMFSDTASQSYNIRNPLLGFQLIAIGWCVALSHDFRTKASTAVFSVGIILVFWHATILLQVFLCVSVISMLYVPFIRLPIVIARICRQISAASIFIYLLHPFVIHFADYFFVKNTVFFFILCLFASFSVGVLAKNFMSSARQFGPKALAAKFRL